VRVLNVHSSNSWRHYYGIHTLTTKSFFPFYISVAINISIVIKGEIMEIKYTKLPIPVAARAQAWVCGRSLAEIVRSNPAGDTDLCVL
jgi:hypothetical protein